MNQSLFAYDTRVIFPDNTLSKTTIGRNKVANSRGDDRKTLHTMHSTYLVHSSRSGSSVASVGNFIIALLQKNSKKTGHRRVMIYIMHYCSIADEEIYRIIVE